ncbi:hypothetical protein GGR51DRAFT_325639 [Nemania sp. FL0031]|nr:hypothetical protein GGR51DRAFT_325639 [Nemania sp. FL0031]
MHKLNKAMSLKSNSSTVELKRSLRSTYVHAPAFLFCTVQCLPCNMPYLHMPGTYSIQHTGYYLVDTAYIGLNTSFPSFPPFFSSFVISICIFDILAWFCRFPG